MKYTGSILEIDKSDMNVRKLRFIPFSDHSGCVEVKYHSFGGPTEKYIYRACPQTVGEVCHACIEATNMWRSGNLDRAKDIAFKKFQFFNAEIVESTTISEIGCVYTFSANEELAKALFALPEYHTKTIIYEPRQTPIGRSLFKTSRKIVTDEPSEPIAYAELRPFDIAHTVFKTVGHDVMVEAMRNAGFHVEPFETKYLADWNGDARKN